MTAEILSFPSDNDNDSKESPPISFAFEVILDEPDLQLLMARADILGISMSDMVGRLCRIALRSGAKVPSTFSSIGAEANRIVDSLRDKMEDDPE